MISGNNFPNMNCIAVIGHKLQNGDMFFLFFCFFLFFLFFLFFSLGFRASGITCIWFSIEKMFLEVKNVFVSLFFSFLFLMKKRKNKKNENVSIFREKKEIIYVLQGCSWRDVLRKTLRFFALWWHFGSQSLVWSVVRFHFNFSADPCRLQPMVLWPVRPSVIEKSTQ